MITDFQVDETLLQEALSLSGYSNVSVLLNTALREYIQRRQQQKILELFGTIDYHENYNYKEQRKIT